VLTVLTVLILPQVLLTGTVLPVVRAS
jgi:hypothetical protein